MVAVAVAGGTGAVGRTIVNALLSSGQHKVFVLSRNGGGGEDQGTPQKLKVDYNNVDTIAAVLRDNGIEAVISALVLFDQAASDSQINLIRGAARSGTVNKFIPSEYHLDFHVPIDGIELSFKEFQLLSEHELEKHPQLTWTLVRNGMFLDYLVMPLRPQPSNLMPWSIFVDMKHSTCVFPADGTQTMIFTHSADLAAYIECLIGLPASQWPRHALITGNRLQLKELATIVQQITGRHFEVVYDAAEDIRQGRITQLPSNQSLFSDPEWGDLYRLVEKEAMCTLLSNGYDLKGTDLGKMFPHIKTTTVEEIFRSAYASEQVPA